MISSLRSLSVSVFFYYVCIYTGSEKPYFGGNIFSDPIDLFTDSDTILIAMHCCLARVYENVNKQEDRKTLPCFLLIRLFLYLFQHGFTFLFRPRGMTSLINHSLAGLALSLSHLIAIYNARFKIQMYRAHF